MLIFIISFVSKSTAQDLYIFPDRSSCVSGDTVGFHVAIAAQYAGKSNVVHVQLTDSQNRIINSIARRSSNGWAEGFIDVPDSLGTGVYFLSSCFFGQSTISENLIHQKTLFVYNRFQKDLSEINVPLPGQALQHDTENMDVRIITTKETYSPRSRVTADIEFGAPLSGKLQHVIIKAEVSDGLAHEYGGSYINTTSPSYPSVPFFEETNGLVVHGRVLIAESEVPPPKTVVFLSLMNDSVYLDYCISDSLGYFSFFLKDAEGLGAIVLQAVSPQQEEMRISLIQSPLVMSDTIRMMPVHLKDFQKNHIVRAADGAWLMSLFSEAFFNEPPAFSMPPRFDTPFYGKPYRVVDPDEYYELPGFREIARELLPGVRYRVRDNDISIRLLNAEKGVYFEDEPFRLVNGIPVFNNRLLSSFGTNDIHHIGYVTEDRVYGDLRFNGVLAVYLKEPFRFLLRHPDVYNTVHLLLQPDRKLQYGFPDLLVKNLPDFRKVFFCEKMEMEGHGQIEFNLSDLKGTVIISVEGVSDEGKILKASKTIEVK